MRHKTCTALAIACVVFASQASAQTIMRALQRSGLTQEDLNIMVEAGSGLYKSGNAVVGADTIWSNPNTEAHGMAEITEVAGKCVRIAYSFRTARQSRIQRVLVRRCLSDGQWILSD